MLQNLRQYRPPSFPRPEFRGYSRSFVYRDRFDSTIPKLFPTAEFKFSRGSVRPFPETTSEKIKFEFQSVEPPLRRIWDPSWRHAQKGIYP